MNIYVGNLSQRTTERELEELFKTFGDVNSCKIITDRDTGYSKGFGFIEMSDGAQEAIDKLNGADFMGKDLVVNEARPREERSNSYGGGGGYNRGGGGGYGGGNRGGGGGGYGNRNSGGGGKRW